MNSRELVLKAVRHEDVDRVPLFYRDEPSVEKRLLRDLGLTCRDELLEFLGIDFREVAPEYRGPELTKENGNKLDIWGNEYLFMELQEGGYWHQCFNPLIDAEDIGALDYYPWPSLDWFDFSSIKAQLDKYEGFAIMTAPGYTSPGVLATAQAMIGSERALTDMYLNPDFLSKLYEKVLDFNLSFLGKLFEAADGRIDFVRIGDDYGTQKALLMSPELWKQFVQPPLAAMSKIMKQNGAFHYQHSCGAISELIPLLIETGVDVLDPLQVKAKHMDPASLKEKYGKQICFSGGVDEQELLCRGSKEDVESYVNSLLDVMMPGGGFFVGPTHNFQDDIPTENIVALYETAKRWKRKGG